MATSKKTTTTDAAPVQPSDPNPAMDAAPVQPISPEQARVILDAKDEKLPRGHRRGQ